MNKELEALENHKLVLKALGHKNCEEWENLKDIEQALKELEQLRKLKLLSYPSENDEEYRQRIIKKLMALEIIKEKLVDIGWLIRSENCSKYNLGVGNSQVLKRTEYDLVKEVLE